MAKIKRILLGLVFLAFFIFALLFAGENNQPVVLSFFSKNILTLPFALWLVLGFVLGAVVVLVLMAPVLAARQLQIRSLRKKADSARSKHD
jgi:uncharacterized integral membrane protein